MRSSRAGCAMSVGSVCCTRTPAQPLDRAPKPTATLCPCLTELCSPLRRGGRFWTCSQLPLENGAFWPQRAAVCLSAPEQEQDLSGESLDRERYSSELAAWLGFREYRLPFQPLPLPCRN